MSLATIGLIKLALLVLVVVAAVLLAIQASKGQSIGVVLLKCFGVFVSTIPLLGIIQWLVFKSKSPGYSKACATQAVIGIVWYGLVTLVLNKAA